MSCCYDDTDLFARNLRAGATFDWLFFDNSKLTDFDD